MGTNYTLHITNEAPEAGTFCVYTKNDSAKMQANLLSLAWFTKAVEQGVKANFSWNVDYSFVWSESGTLAKGVHFDVSQKIDADPLASANRKIYFEKGDHGFHFGDSDRAEEVQEGFLGITCAENIPPNQAAVGIGISGQAALAVNAEPRFQITFEPHITYYVAYGDFIQGEVIDVNQVTRTAYKLVFPAGETERTIILTSKNEWNSGDKYP
ncbi:MAG: hypothetical protein LBT13_03525 [Treponema sp.]|nr:hypothetical protein [Treponema sp.]